MKLALIFLNKIEYLEELLAAFLEIGVSGATVMDSVGMGHIISQNIPIFAGLRDAFAGSSPSNKLILIVTKDAMVMKIAEVLRDIFSEEEDGKPYFMTTFAVDELFGFG
jgi:nitrogen regulatory protein PII